MQVPLPAPRFFGRGFRLSGFAVAGPEQPDRRQYQERREQHEHFGAVTYRVAAKQPAAGQRAQRAQAGHRPIEDLSLFILEHAVDEGPVLLRNYNDVGFLEHQQQESQPAPGVPQQRPGHYEESGAAQHGHGHGLLRAYGGEQAAVAVDHGGHHEGHAGYGVGLGAGAELFDEDGLRRRADEFVTGEEEHGGEAGQENGPGHVAAPFCFKRSEKCAHV